LAVLLKWCAYYRYADISSSNLLIFFSIKLSS
jgi:hypothetical protein